MSNNTKENACPRCGYAAAPNEAGHDCATVLQPKLAAAESELALLRGDPAAVAVRAEAVADTRRLDWLQGRKADINLVHRHGRCFWIDTEAPSRSAGCSNLREAIDFAMRSSHASEPVPAADPAPLCTPEQRLCVRYISETTCGNRQPNGLRSYCSNPHGHHGDHLACVLENSCESFHNLARWPQEPAAVPESESAASKPSAGDPATLAFLDAALQHHGSPAAGGAA